ncbi:phage tail protein [uncultured Amnibacterium sp.]|uniref:phage tail protein n=1 Tax=uncultured Amnibacterium sp. TaxID=1631851 RepID=UPI0035CAA2A7
MRGTVDGLGVATPLSTRLPGVLQDDAFIELLCGAVDELLAPVLLTLDSLEAYVDPALTPQDFLPWLGTWVGFDSGAGWGADRTRALIARATAMHAGRGTIEGVRFAVSVAAGADAVVVVEDTGGVAVSAVPDGRPPAGGPARVTVTVTGPETAAPEYQQRLRSVVAAAVPASVPFTVRFPSDGAA